MRAWRTLVAIALGGAIGTPARYAISRVLPVAKGSFPWATFVTNVSGAFAIGLFLTLLFARYPPSRCARPFFAIGVLGSYTTYSTMAVETVTLVKDHHAALGLEYFTASVAAGIAACYGGVMLARLR
jgi:CrcB protein